MRAKIIVGGVVAAIAAALVASMAMAQPGGGGAPGGGGRGGGQRGMRDPAEMRRMMTERMKEQLGATDQEWKVIEPRLQKVMELNRQVSGPGRMGMGFGRQGRRQGGQAPGQNREMTGVEKAAEDLQQTLANESATSDQLKAKLTALREAREKTKQELAAAQQDLKQVLTVKQEATLVLMGLLN